MSSIYKDDIKLNNINLNSYGNRTKKFEKNKRNNTISLELKKYNNNNSSSDFIYILSHKKIFIFYFKKLIIK